MVVILTDSFLPIAFLGSSNLHLVAKKEEYSISTKSVLNKKALLKQLSSTYAKAL